jgi:hypothetical protein
VGYQLGHARWLPLYNFFFFSDIVEGERLGNNLPLLFWPFLLIGFWEFIVSVGFLAQGKIKKE